MKIILFTLENHVSLTADKMDISYFLEMITEIVFFGAIQCGVHSFKAKLKKCVYNIFLIIEVVSFEESLKHSSLSL